jgi:hypothetical protein
VSQTTQAHVRKKPIKYIRLLNMLHTIMAVTQLITNKYYQLAATPILGLSKRVDTTRLACQPVKGQP